MDYFDFVEWNGMICCNPCLDIGTESIEMLNAQWISLDEYENRRRQWLIEYFFILKFCENFDKQMRTDKKPSITLDYSNTSYQMCQVN